DEILDELDPGAALKIVHNLLNEKRTVILFSSKMLDIFTDISCNILVLHDGKLTDTKGMNETDIQKLLIKEGLIINNKSSVKQNFLKSTDPLITIKNLRYQYPRNNNFKLFIENFQIDRGEIVSLAGKNGSGKSTLGKLIAGLKEKKSGVLTVNEKNNLSCAYLFQNPDYQIFLPSVGEELSFGLKLQDSEILDTIAKFNLPDKNVPPALMSYGARKRLQAAVYYLMDRDIYILDEADAGLSLKDYDNLINLLYKKEKCILIISHNLNLCSRYSDRVYLIDSGHVEYVVEDNTYNNLSSYFVDGKSQL
ncbi:MAG: ATP-binding cassette domain-containing protein, partial [Spirochaetales bacterium]|nr:ATP-binding cassette domain-containing protein [Spirochaetales bacterium]